MTDKEFYPIILIPNKISQSIKNEIKKEEVYKYLKAEVPKLVKLSLPTVPSSYKNIKKTHTKIQGKGCTTIAFLPIGILFILASIHGLINGQFGGTLILWVFTIFIIIMAFRLETVTTTKRIDIPSDIYSEQRKEYLKNKKLIEDKNKTLEKEYREKKDRFDEEFAKKEAHVKHQIHLQNLSPTSEATRSNKDVKRGKSELLFLSQLYNKFGNQIKVDMTPMKNYEFYFPDFTFICNKTNLHIDIEIDEPYSFSDKKPIHHTETNDNARNNYFLEQNWCVIRFSEKQILQETHECVSLIEEVVQCIHNKSLEFPKNTVSIDKRWTYEEALVMSYNNTRNQY